MSGTEMKQMSIRKILQALYYIQKNTPETNESKTAPVFLLKMLYFADRYHLRHFGILGSGDEYFAMKKGPVASATMDILKGKWPQKANSAEIELLKEVVELDEFSVLIKEQDDDELSLSFKEALDFSLQTFGKYEWNELSRISHDYPEWKKHEGEVRKNPYSRYPMKLKDFFSDPVCKTNLKLCHIEEDPFKDDTVFLNAMRDEIDRLSC